MKAQDDRALELAVGSGRVALPLAAAGVSVDGGDFSEPMLTRLRAKPGGNLVRTFVGDFADVPVDGTYSLIYNTLFNLLTQDNQVRCFGNAVRHPTPNGVFVVEAFTPSLPPPATRRPVRRRAASKGAG